MRHAALHFLTASALALSLTTPDIAARTEWREVTIPAGTVLPVVLDTSVASATSRVEQGVRGHLARTTTVNGIAVFPRGTPV